MGVKQLYFGVQYHMRLVFRAVMMHEDGEVGAAEPWRVTEMQAVADVKRMFERSKAELGDAVVSVESHQDVRNN
jgi:hypothetical protein